ncbi:MAG: N-acetylmuramoyl-L-alanine amidase [Verrucomicrobiota bacterium]|nr:N-acetylmuramoyl-L-alanine amidase [Verrucomicrobiota bacterium]
MRAFSTIAFCLSLFWAEQSVGWIGDPATKRLLICIDPGHPSENNDGKELTNGLREVSVNWEVAVLLKQELERDGFTVVVTKHSELEFVSNKDRATAANNAHADLLLRLHADAGPGRGFTVYYPRKAGTAHGVMGPSPDVLRSSSAAARLFYPAFAAALSGKPKDNGLRGDEETLIGSRQGALTGSIFSKVPTVLVEMAFLTNEKDAEWIRQEGNKKVMAHALAAGIRAIR